MVSYRLFLGNRVAAGTTISAGVASLTLTTYAPTIVVTAHQTISTGAGALALTGYAPSIVVNSIIQPSTAALALTGYEPTVTVSAAGAIEPGVATLSLTGFAPTISVTEHQTVQPGAGQITLTSYAPTVTQQTFVNPGAAALSITAYAPTITRTTSINIFPAAAQLEFTTYAPTIIGGVATARRKDAGKPSKKRRRRWVLPNNMHVYATEEEAIAIAQSLVLTPVVAVSKKPATRPKIILDDGAISEAIAIYPVNRRKESAIQDAAIARTQTAEPDWITAEKIYKLIEEKRLRLRRRKAAILLLH